MSKVVVVTGASSGVGRATARAFGARGDSVALLARGPEGLAGVAEEVEKAGGRALAMPVDVSNHDQVEAAASSVEEAFGPIDVWVNNAMTTVFGEFLEISPDEFRRATEVTYLGVVWGTRSALKRMSERDAGSIVQVGSALAYRGIPLQSAYCGSKHAELGFFNSLRCELRHRKSKVRMSMVQLPGLNTPQFDHCETKMPDQPMPVPPIFEPEVAARAVVWASEHKRREVYVGLPTVFTIVGNKLAPWLAERYLARTAYKGQQVQGEPIHRPRPSNLFAPLEEDAGARGRFDDQAHDHSVQAFLSRHRGWLGAGMLAGVAGAGAGLFSRR